MRATWKLVGDPHVARDEQSEVGVSLVSGDNFSVSNLSVQGLDVGKNGDPSLSLDEPLYPVDFKSVFFKTRNRISESDAQIIAEGYETGLSFRDISMQFGWTTTEIRRELQRRGIKPRDGRNLATGVRALKPGKQGSLPYFGFCNFEGRIVKDPREFPVLQVIHRHWSRGKTIHQISLELNKAKILSRTGKQWSWAALQNIVVRFETKKIILSNGGKYELR